MRAALPLSAAAQRHRDRDRDRARDRDEDDYTSRIDTTLAFGPRGTVDLRIASGDIVVTAWNRDEVKVHAYSERGSLQFEPSQTSLTLSVRSRYGSTGDTRYEVTVPAGTRVLMQSASGDISVSGTRGEIDARSASGDVQISDAADRVSVHTISGEIQASRIAGNLSVETVSGDLQIDRVAGDVDVATVSGEISLSDIRSKYVKANTTSGEVQYQGTVDDGGRYDFHSHSGGVRVSLPSSAGASLTLETYSGEIDSDFPMTLQPSTEVGHNRPRRLEFTIGRGGARISATTFSGDVRIERADGRRERDRDNDK